MEKNIELGLEPKIETGYTRKVIDDQT